MDTTSNPKRGIPKEYIPYVNLAIAVVSQAVEDLHSAYSNGRFKTPGDADHDAEYYVAECETWLRSKEAGIYLLGLDPEYIINRTRSLGKRRKPMWARNRNR